MKTRHLFSKPASVIALTLLTLAAFATTQAKDKEAPITTPEISPPTAQTSGFLGVVPRPLDHVMRSALDYEEPGVLLGQIIRDSPAEKAGLAVGDILVKVNAKSVHDPERLMSLMRDFRAGDSVDLLLVHGGKSRTVKVTLAPRPAPRVFSWNQAGDADANDLQGMIDQELESVAGEQHDVEVELEGLEQELEGLKIYQSDSPEHRKVRIIRKGTEEPIYN